MAKKNIFTIGGTVQAGEGIYIPRQADDQLLDLCREGAFSYILTSRQMGKSSLMLRTAERLKTEGILSATIDLQQLGTQLNAEQWYLGILITIYDSLALETDVLQWWSDNKHLGMTHRLTQFFQNILLKERKEQIIIFIDEIDTTLRLGFTDDFFIAIRYLYNARADIPEFKRLSFVLIGVATPGDLIADPQRTPFNIGKRVDLSDFTFDEAKPFIAGFDMPPDKAEKILGWVMKWTGGHPYLTQKLCATIASEHVRDWTEQDINSTVTRTFFDVTSEEDHNLQFVRDMLTKRAPQGLERDTLITYREIYQDKKPIMDAEQSIVKNHLKLSGIVTRQNQILCVSNSIYKEVFNLDWLKDNLPIDLLRRLRRVLFVLVLSIILMTILAGTTWWAIESRKEAIKQRLIAESQRQEADRQRKIAEDSTKAAQIQRTIAVSQKDRAEILANAEKEAHEIAVSEQKRAEKEKFISDGLRKEEEKARLVAEERRKEIERRRYVDIARFLATEAPNQQQLGFADRALLLARQAFLFNDKYGGQWSNQIYNSLLKTLSGAGGPIVLRGHTAAVRCVAFNGNGEMLASGSDDGTISIWNLRKSHEESQILADHKRSVRSLVFNPTDNILASASDDQTVRLWNLETFPPGSECLSLHQDQVWTTDISADGKMLATGGADSTVMLWDLNNLTANLRVSLKHKSWVRSVAFTPGCHWLASACEDGTLKIWNIEKRNPQIVADFRQESGIRSMAFRPDSTILVTGGIDGKILQWTLSPLREKLKMTLQMPAHESAVNCVAFSSDGRLLASGGFDKKVKIWCLAEKTNEPMLILEPNDWVWSVAFSPDGKLLASASEDKNVYLWYTQAASLAEKVCSIVDRNLTTEEWRNFIGKDIGYECTCENLPTKLNSANELLTPLK